MRILNFKYAKQRNGLCHVGKTVLKNTHTNSATVGPLTNLAQHRPDVRYRESVRELLESYSYL